MLTQRFAQLIDQPQTEKRMAAEIEEVIVAPTRSTPSTAAQMAATFSSTSRFPRDEVVGGLRVAEFGAGSAVRSSLPFEVRGNAGSVTTRTAPCIRATDS